MYNPKEYWYPKFVELQQLLKKPENIDKIKQLISYLHGQLHSSNVYQNNDKTYYDIISENIVADNFAICPRKTNMTIAWDLWHITRIEDLTTSILLFGDNQVFDDYRESLSTSITDTGNAMTDEQVFSFSNEVSMDDLILYRQAVGKKTRSYIDQLNTSKLSLKFKDKDIIRIKNEGGVIKETEWLMDYWGRKTVASIITMPITKHQIIHLNDCRNIINWYKKSKKLPLI